MFCSLQRRKCSSFSFAFAPRAIIPLFHTIPPSELARPCGIDPRAVAQVGLWSNPSIGRSLSHGACFVGDFPTQFRFVVARVYKEDIAFVFTLVVNPVITHGAIYQAHTYTHILNSPSPSVPLSEEINPLQLSGRPYRVHGAIDSRTRAVNYKRNTSCIQHS